MTAVSGRNFSPVRLRGQISRDKGVKWGSSEETLDADSSCVRCVWAARMRSAVGAGRTGERERAGVDGFSRGNFFVY